jgi:RNA polymerase sigma factor (sigma-70 family)
MDESNLNALVQAAQHGDRHAATQLIELSYARIYAFLRRYTGHDADAADLTQRTFSRAWQALPTFARKSSFHSWLHAIAHHIYVDWRRGQGRLESRPIEWWEDCVAPEPSSADVSQQNDLATAVFSRVDGLSPELRATVHLHYYQELTLQETADALGVATSTVKYRLRQALAELQKQLSAKTTSNNPNSSPKL